LAILVPSQQASLLRGFLPPESEWRAFVGAAAAVSVLLVLFLWSSLFQGFLPLKGEWSLSARAATIWPHSDGLMKIGGDDLPSCLHVSSKLGSFGGVPLGVLVGSIYLWSDFLVMFVLSPL
jgi:hypothetical protein